MGRRHDLVIVQQWLGLKMQRVESLHDVPRMVACWQARLN
jgi:hypothetical protein